MKSLLLCLIACLLLASCGDKPTSGQEPVRAASEENTVYHSDNYTVNWISTPDSTCFSRISYDSRHDVLAVEFRDSGAQYAYFDVESRVWDELNDAYSMGGYYNSDIKGHYNCERIQ